MHRRLLSLEEDTAGQSSVRELGDTNAQLLQDVWGNDFLFCSLAFSMKRRFCLRSFIFPFVFIFCSPSSIFIISCSANEKVVPWEGKRSLF